MLGGRETWKPHLTRACVYHNRWRPQGRRLYCITGTADDADNFKKLSASSFLICVICGSTNIIRSRSISRILSRMVICLGRALLTGSCGTPGCLRRAAAPRVYGGIPIVPCSTWGLPGRRVTTPPVRSYRTVSPLPRLRGAVYFLLHWPSGHPASPLASTLPCGVRTFLSDSHRSNHLTDSAPYYSASTPACLRMCKNNRLSFRWKPSYSES